MGTNRCGRKKRPDDNTKQFLKEELGLLTTIDIIASRLKILMVKKLIAVSAEANDSR